MPDPQTGPPDIELLIETEPGVELEAQAEGTPCQVRRSPQQQGQPWLYQVTVPPELTEARLVAVKVQSGGEAVRVPLHVPLRRLRWTLTGDTDQVDSQRLRWTGRLIKQSLDALEETTDPILFVDFGPPGEIDDSVRATVKLILVDLDGQTLQEMSLSRPLRDPDSLVWRFELTAFLTTIRHTASPTVRFELEYSSQAGQARLPLLSLSRSMQVDRIQVDLQETGPVATLRVTWQEPVSLRHRRVRFWPLWRPWRLPREEIIPDGSAGELDFSVTAPDFLAGKYLLEFFMVDPWVAPAPASLQPPTSGPNLAIVELTPPEVRLEQIEQDIRAIGPSFGLFLEHAFIEADRQQVETVLTDLWKCYEWFDQASLPQILAMVDLAQQVDDPELLPRLRLKMSEPDRIRRLLLVYQDGQLSQAQLDAYRRQMLLRAGIWPVDTCEILQDFPYEPVQIFAIMHLIRSGAQVGGQIILERIKNHRFSDRDGVGLLEINLDFAATFLANCLDDADARRLFTRLTERYPEREWPVLLVRPGFFVRSCAGWGQIDKIESLNDDQLLDHFVRDETGFRLQLTLRPNHDNVAVTVELLANRQRLLFPANLRLYRCTRSKECAFATPDANLLYHGHNRVAHEGIGAQYEPKESPMLSIQPLEYRLRAPQNMLR